MPFTNDAFQNHLNSCRRCMALMVRSSMFNEDKTALITTNNPLPDLKSNPTAFFTKEQFGTRTSPRSQIHFPLQKTQQKGPTAPKATFPAETAGKRLPFRFSKDSDFEAEGRFSKSYAEKQMKRQYPQLRYQAPPKPGAKSPFPEKGREGWVEPSQHPAFTYRKAVISRVGKGGE
ncbi:testis-specific gene 13 protein [Struthio camelus]|uniref:testis-specific gene 13 protein n=1 Tax=Struthio camelus TaxID=8801 RepID=UPI0036041C80